MFYLLVIVFILLGNGFVIVIIGNFFIYNYKMYIFNENGFLSLSCMKDIFFFNYYGGECAFWFSLYRVVFVLVNGGGCILVARR